MKEKICEYIKAHTTEWLDELASIVSYDSVYGKQDEIEACANKILSIMERSGVSGKLYYGQSESPFIIAQAVAGEESAPTILIYGHYDVKPAGNRELWQSDPFCLTEKNNRLYARGVADDKGQWFMWLKGLQACQDLFGRPLCNVKFILEGGEEVGSPGLKEFMVEHKAILASDICIDSDGAKHSSDRMTIRLGVKGIYAPVLEVKTANRDVHSMYGSTVPNAAWRMIEFLSSLRNAKTGEILIGGFYDNIVKLDEETLKVLQSIPDESEAIKESLGISDFAAAPHSKEYRYNFIMEPTCNINSFVSGYVGESSNNIVPHIARCRLDFRLVPNQTPSEIHNKLLAHIEKNGFSDVQVVSYEDNVLPIRISAKNRFVQMIAKTVENQVGQAPIIYPNGAGASPLKIFSDSIGTDAIIFPLCASDQCEHAPNENMKAIDFKHGILVTASIISQIGQKN